MTSPLDDRVFLFFEFLEEFGVEFVLWVVFEVEGVVDVVDEVVGEALAHGTEGGIGPDPCLVGT